MDRNRKLITVAIIIVIIQFFCFFLPTFSRVKEGERVESYSTQQVLVNYTDTLDDPSAEELWTMSWMGRLVTCVTHICALILVINAKRVEEDDDKKALSALLGASACITFSTGFNILLLLSIFTEAYHKTSAGLLFTGFCQVIAPIAVFILLKCYDEMPQSYRSRRRHQSSADASENINPDNDTDGFSDEFSVRPIVQGSALNKTLKCPVCEQDGMSKNRRSCIRCGISFETE